MEKRRGGGGAHILVGIYNDSSGAKYLNGLSDSAENHEYNLKKKQEHAIICSISLTNTQAMQNTP